MRLIFGSCATSEGACFSEQNGVIPIQLKCTNIWGDYVNADIFLQRNGNDKLIATSQPKQNLTCSKMTNF